MLPRVRPPLLKYQFTKPTYSLISPQLTQQSLSATLISSTFITQSFTNSCRSRLTMSDRDRSRPVTQRLYDSSPSSRQSVKFLTAATVGATLLLFSGLTLTGTVIALILATPLLVLFSPILVPAGIVIFLVTTGFVFSGGCGLAAITTLSWIYNYVAGKHPPGADTLDYARMRIADTAREMRDRAKDYGQYVQYKAQEATQ